ncbi:hypothetical protein V6N12_001271 [Hibiscus sabdariffa]|uniref:Uncharacterized protein n=1 Tax=Hibiscus sabdariffa TaxID=183260 RepID=A0ABR2C8P1_9ROSI
MEQLWNENHEGLVNLRKIDLLSCKNLRGIPNLSGAINLKLLGCRSCKSLDELPCLNDLASLERLELSGCKDLCGIPNLSGAINLKILDCSLCKSLDALPGLNHLTSLERLNLSSCKNLREIPNLSGAINLKILECRSCKSLDAIPDLNHLASLERLDLSGCKNLRRIPNLSGANNLKILDCSSCKSLDALLGLSGLASLESLDLSDCKNLRTIPNLLGATNLKILCCNQCESLVELPCLNHLTSLKTLQFEGCYSLKNFPELDLSNTDIEEVFDSIRHLVRLRELRLRNSKVKIVSSNISELKYLHTLDLGCCKGLKSFSELPRYLRWLDASDCTSLEKVSFTDNNDSCDDANEENIFMLFSNCKSLNQDSIHNIEANAMLQIKFLAQRWERREQRRGSNVQKKLFCCFSGNVISANQFDYQSVDSSLELEIAPNQCSESRRALAFAICLVANLRCENRGLAFFCKYQLRVTGEEEFKECRLDIHERQSFRGDHVFILFSEDMVIIDENYKEASFEFDVKYVNGEEIEGGDNKVKKCGVQVLYFGKDHGGSATNKRKFSYDGEEGDGGPKRVK